MDLNSLYRQSKIWKSTPKMPALFLGHGSPMNAIEDNPFVQGFKTITKRIPTPKAILCISAHWETKGTKVTAMDMPRTIHDFGGFPKALYDIQYPAPGSPDLAKETAQLMAPLSVTMDYDWGLDHGAWSVIKHLYPEANIPVIQMSLDDTQGPKYHFTLGQKLRVLRHKGILIIGSGNMVHNLRRLHYSLDQGYDWALEARAFINNKIALRDFKSLFDYHSNKALQLAIPTPEHFLPLLYTLALQETDHDHLSLFNDDLVMGSISMTSVFID
ncbi:4,5-DOPA dioxygenase extradiol [Aestuariivivens sediminis]|uniref:4,5-DOPA-extradiol-dioxygenase n=1 Tax=Aestuariivivens sediminis TaxID=2913557 RepID=UPI001F5985AF|nr:4,5-DOPA dioxygenase extradiol [Aestuariivivens sediminis]